MTTNEIITKVRELKELEMMLQELTVEIDLIKDDLKAEMTARDIEEMQADIFTLRYKEHLQSRIDSKTLKKELPDVYGKYANTIKVKRFTVA